MPRKGNPQHNARKRVARERHQANHEQRQRDQQRRKPIAHGVHLAVAAAAAAAARNRNSQ